jgi:hypothetical protein
VGATNKESQLPVGTGFSPDLVSLPDYLRAAVEHSGKVDKLEEALNAPPVWIDEKKLRTTRRTRRHPLEAGAQYGLLTPRTYEATDLTRRLAAQSEDNLYQEFARHILLNLGGLRVVEGAQEMYLDGREVTGDALAQYLSDQGFRVSVHNTAINTMRMWLAKAGLFPENGRVAGAWRPDLAVKKQLLGMNDEDIAALAALTPEQIAFAKALARLNPDDWVQAAEVRDLAEAAEGVRIGRGSLPNEVLRPLEAAGLIKYRTGGTSSGKTSELKTREAFRAEVLEPFLERTLKDLDPALTAYYRKRPTDIYNSLASKNKHEKGQALEAFAVMVMRLLGLRFVGWRRRAEETGYSEVDVLMAGLFGVVPTTWQVQCKNTPSGQVRLEDVAKEVGLIPLTRATHILVLANAPFTRDARRYADSVMQHSSVTIFLLDQTDFRTIGENSANLGRILQAHAERIHNLKMATPVWRESDV